MTTIHFYEISYLPDEPYSDWKVKYVSAESDREYRRCLRAIVRNCADWEVKEVSAEYFRRATNN